MPKLNKRSDEDEFLYPKFAWQNTSKYMPHQGQKERWRRRKQAGSTEPFRWVKPLDGWTSNLIVGNPTIKINIPDEKVIQVVQNLH